MSVPKISSPLAKSIRTGEGILVYVFNSVLAIAAILPNGLSWTHAALYAAIVNAVHVASRTLLKISAVQKGLGVDAPIPFEPGVDPAAIADVVSTVLGGNPPPPTPGHENVGLPVSSTPPAGGAATPTTPAAA